MVEETGREPIQISVRVCTECSARVSMAGAGTACPACGGALVLWAELDRDIPGLAPRQIDRRGIILPRRHAVGGVITPR
jgi:hypothetical protein